MLAAAIIGAAVVLVGVRFARARLRPRRRRHYLLLL